MTITKRTTKGSALTYAEMDENFRDLDSDMTLDRVLKNGNSTSRLPNLTSLPKLILEKTGSQTIADNASNDVDFGTVITDTHNGFDSSGDIVYTCKQTGFYQIDATAVSDDGSADARDLVLALMEADSANGSYAAVIANGISAATNDLRSLSVVVSGLRTLTENKAYKIKAYYNSNDDGSGSIVINANAINSSVADDMERNGSVTRWSMYQVL